MNAPEPLLQSGLAHLYRLQATPKVEAFRLDREQAAAFSSPVVRETLLVRTAQPEDEQAADLGLYIEEKTRQEAVAFLQACAQGQEPETLDGFATALEGVSHFVYLTHTVEVQERGVSALELELQAELDKYVVLRAWLGLGGLHWVERLFERFLLSDGLSPSERERYLVANREARRFARWFEACWSLGRAHQAMQQARRLYRVPLASKLEAISRMTLPMSR